MELQVDHHPGRFFARIGDLEAELVYERRGNLLDVYYTWTPPPLRGNDLAARLTDAAFAYARQHDLKIIPTCSYTRTYLTTHPELQPLVADV